MGSGRPGNRITAINKDGAIWTYDRTLTAVNSEDIPPPLASKMIVTDPLTNVTDARGSFTDSTLSKITNPLLKVTEFTYAGTVKPWETKLPEGNIQRVNYAGDMVYNARLIAKPSIGGADIYTSSVIADVCSGSVICNAYTSITDPKGNVTDFTYDATYGVLLTKTQPADASGVRPQSRNTYTLMSAQVKNSAGLTVSSDPIYMLTKTSTCRSATSGNPASCVGTVQETVTTYTYEPGNLRVGSMTVAAGDGSLSSTTSYTYDKYGNQISEDGPLTGTVDTAHATYDIAGRKILEIAVDPDGASVGSPCTSGCIARKVVKHTYNADNQETLTEVGTGNSATGSDFVSLQQTDTVYDSRGRKAIVIVREGATVHSLTQTNYYADDKLKCTAVRMNPATYSGITTATDACTPLTESTAYGPDRVTQNIYDAAGQLTEVKEAVGTPIVRSYARYTYTNNGLKATEKDANNNLTTLGYDGHDRLKNIYYPKTAVGDGASNLASNFDEFAYDANGNRTYWKRRDDQVINDCFDNLSRVVVHYVHAQSGCSATGGVKDVYTSYDLQGRVLAKRFASTAGAGVTYLYDGRGRVSSTTDMNGRTVGYQYNVAGARVRTTYPDSNWIGATVDYANRLKTTGWNTTYGLYARGYNNLGQLITELKGSGATYYTYDAIGRLATLNNNFAGTASDVTWTFGYNPASQMISTTSASAVYDYEELSSITEPSQAHDGLNRISTLVGATTACPSGGYDARQNLVCDGTGRTYSFDIENRLLTGNVAGNSLVLTYDPEGRLASYSWNGGTTSFLYDGVDLIGEYNSSNNLLRRYFHGGGTDNPVLWYEGSDNSVLRYFYKNYQGSVIAIADNAGNRGDIYAYGAYGEPKDQYGFTYWPSIGTGATSVSRFGYTGQMFLADARLYYYKARVYDPEFGRFLQTDPIGAEDDLNLYAYVGGDPVNKVDPDGSEAYCISHAPSNCWGDPNDPETGQREQRAGMVMAGVTAVGGTALALRSASPLALAVSSTVRSAWVKLTLSGAYRTAAAGGRHSGFLRQALQKTSSELKGTIRSMEKNIQKHRDFLKDPAKAVKEKGGDWSKLSQQQKDGLVKHWTKEIDNFEDQSKIAKDVLRGMPDA